MAGTGSSIPTPTPGPDIGVVRDGRSVDDYNLPPPATNPDLAPPPPITNTHLPDPVLLDKAASDPTPRELSISAARIHDPEPVAFGHCIAKGKLIAADDSGPNLILDILWNGYPSDYFVGMWVDGVFEGRADMLGKMQHFEGGPGQVVSSIMDPLKGNDYDVLPGKTHSVLTWNPAYPSLQIEGEGRWTLCRDPRLSPHDYVFTENFALHLAFVLEELGYTPNWASVATAADHCDDSLHSPAVARWAGGGQIYSRLSDKEIIKLLATYADCYVDLIGGEVYLIPDASRSPNHTVTEDDIQNPDTIKQGHAGSGNVPEAVTVYGMTVEGEEISHTYGTPGGPGTITELRLPWLQTVDACGRKAEEVYKKAQKDMTFEFVSFDNSIRRTIGDVGTVTNAVFELSAEPMTLIENEEISRGRWRRKYVQYDPDHNSDTLYSDTTNSTSLDNPHIPPDGPTPTIEEILDSDLAGNQFSRLKVTFSPDDWAYIKEYRVTARSTVSGDLDPVILDVRVPNTSAASYTTYTGAARYGVEYDVDVYVVSHTHDESATPGTASATPALELVNLLFRLISWWPLDETSGDREDVHGNNFLSVVDGLNSPMGPGYGTGLISNAFDTLNDGYLQLAGPNDFGFGDTNFTIAGWLYATTLDDVDVITCRQDGTHAWYVQISTGSPNALRLFMADSSGVENVDVTSSAITTGSWFAFRIWHDAANDEMGIQINDETPATGTAPADGPNSPNAAFKLGGADVGSFQFDGLIDEVAVWARLLNDEEWAAFYNSGAGIAYPG